MGGLTLDARLEEELEALARGGQGEAAEGFPAHDGSIFDGTLNLTSDAGKRARKGKGIVPNLGRRG